MKNLPNPKELHPKLCFCASSGGHYWELLQLKEIAEKYDSFTITEKVNFDIEKLSRKMYCIPQVNRRKLASVIVFFISFFKNLAILIREKPNLVISAGAFCTYPAMLISKCLGAKIIFFELSARVNSPSLTGRLIYGLSDLFIVQNEKLLAFYPKAQMGSII